MKKLLYMFVAAAAMTFASCSDDDAPELPAGSSGSGLFVVCNGNYGYGNGSLSFYDPSQKIVENDVFARANGMKLGDVAQSMTINGNTGWIVVNNSGVIFAVDIDTYVEKGRIENLGSPRNIFFVSDDKAYVSMLYDNRIAIVNPKKYEVTGYIDVPEMDAPNGSTEQMVRDGRYVYCNCWSYQNRVIKIDTYDDKVVDELEVGIQPCSITLDANKDLWVLTDGGAWPQNPAGYEAPALHRIDLSSFKVEMTLEMTLGDAPSSLQTNGSGDRLYWINNGVMSMGITETELPSSPVIAGQGGFLNAMTVNPVSGDIYVADALDYQQAGSVYRYTSSGSKIDEFKVGIIPAGFCWK